MAKNSSWKKYTIAADAQYSDFYPAKFMAKARRFLIWEPVCSHLRPVASMDPGAGRGKTIFSLILVGKICSPI